MKVGLTDGYFRKRQSISQFIWGMSSIFLKGYSASVQNFMTIVRNIFALKNDPSKLVQWGIIIGSVVLGIVFNNRGIMGFLPIIGNLEYSICVFYIKNNEKLLKISFLISVITFMIFNIYLLNIVGTITNIIIIISYLTSILKSDKGSLTIINQAKFWSIDQNGLKAWRKSLKKDFV